MLHNKASFLVSFLDNIYVGPQSFFHANSPSRGSGLSVTDKRSNIIVVGISVCFYHTTILFKSTLATFSLEQSVEFLHIIGDQLLIRHIWQFQGTCNVANVR